MHDAKSSALVRDGTRVGRAVMANVLRDAGIEVLEAARGDQSLDLARARRPSVIVADLDLLSHRLEADAIGARLRSPP
jgi:CheY-like chemotaxis protein